MQVDQNPQNPYRSFLVSASAGSGKTYQLSQRFVNLVCAGVIPDKILTVTFTVKAAGEMKQRIISEACELVHSRTKQQEVSQRMHQFKSWAKQHWQQYDLDLPRPIHPKLAGQKILSLAQQLKITTIDSLFKEWIGRFPYESMDLSFEKMSSRIGRDEIADSLNIKSIDDTAWDRLFVDPEYKVILDQMWRCWEEIEPEKSIRSVRSHLESLNRLYGLIWLVEQAQDQQVFSPIADQSRQLSSSLSTVLDQLRPSLECLVQEHKRSEQMLVAVEEKNYAELVSLRVLTAAGKVHGGTFRGKKRDQYAGQIAEIESSLANFLNHQKICKLNNCSEQLQKLFYAWQSERDQQKKRQGLIEFDDLARRSFQLFHNDRGIGAAWFVSRHVQHILLDEFQDTSQIQWSVFSKLMTDWLSGGSDQGELRVPPSVFVVGDPKQSIYGFRLADPKIMNQAEQLLDMYDQPSVTLSKSYRSVRLIMQFVNSVFEERIADFPLHQTATSPEGEEVCRNVGSLACSPLFESDEHRTGLEKEMEWIASQISDCLNNPRGYPIYDKSCDVYRPIRAGDICVLYRNSTHTPILEAALIKAGIAYRREENKGFFSRIEIKDMLALLGVLICPEDISGWLTLLRSPVVNMPNSQVLELLASQDAEAQSAYFSRKWLEAWKLEDPVRYGAFIYLLDHVYQWNPHRLILEIYQCFSVCRGYADVWELEESELAKANLLQLIEIVYELELAGHTLITDVYAELVRMSEEDQKSVAVANSDVVTLMTVHKSKGLEFPYVFVSELGTDWFREDSYWMRTGDSGTGVVFVGTKTQRPTDHLQFDRIVRENQSSSYAESLRLLYVAMTRAGQFLALSGHRSRSEQVHAFYPELLRHLKSLPNAQQDLLSGTWYVGTEELTQIEVCESSQTVVEEFSVNQPKACGLHQPSPLPREVNFVEKHLRELLPFEMKSNRVSDAVLSYAEQFLISRLTGREWNEHRAWWNLCSSPGWVAFPHCDLSEQGHLKGFIKKSLADLMEQPFIVDLLAQPYQLEFATEAIHQHKNTITLTRIPIQVVAYDKKVIPLIGFGNYFDGSPKWSLFELPETGLQDERCHGYYAELNFNELIECLRVK